MQKAEICKNSELIGKNRTGAYRTTGNSTAKTMFLNTNLSEAPIDTVKSQTMIQIWSALEVAAMDMLRDMAGRWSR